MLNRLLPALLGCLLAGSALADPPPRNPKLELSWTGEAKRFPPFTQVLLAPVEIEFRPVQPLSGPAMLASGRTEFPATERDRERLTKDFNEVFRRELADQRNLTLTETAGPGVLVLRPALRDIVWRLPPEEPAGTRIYLDTIADLTLIVDFADGASGQSLATATDRRTAEPANTQGDFGAVRGNRVEASAELRRVARRWGTRLTQRVEQLYYDAKPR